MLMQENAYHVSYISKIFDKTQTVHDTNSFVYARQLKSKVGLQFYNLDINLMILIA